MSNAKFCWHCGKKLVNKFGQAKEPIVFAEHTLPDGHKVRVHKVCLKDVSKKPITAQVRNEQEQERFETTPRC